MIRTALSGVRQTSRGFYGVGCPNIGVDCFVEQTNKLLMHYGCPSNRGLNMKKYLNYMILEMVISLQPLQESYKKYEQWMTPGRLKYLWEKCDWFDVMVEINNTPL